MKTPSLALPASCLFLIFFAAAPSPAADLSGKDKSFLETVCQGGMTEVKLGELAKQKAENAQVKEFGAMMVKDHSKADTELAGLAKANGITLPQSLDQKHSAVVDQLSKLSGSDFDKRYAAQMVKDHEKTIREFESAAQSENAQVKAFASQTLPVLKHHLEKIKDINDAL